MSQSRTVCCCGADTWTKVIAIIQIVLSSIGSGLFLLILLIFLAIGERTFKEALEKIEDEDIVLYKDYAYGLLLGVMLIVLTICVISLIFGVVLLKGAQKRKPSYLCAWIIFTLITLGGDIIFKLVFSHTTISVKEILETVLSILLTFFFVWVVWTFKKEIERDDSNPANDRGVVYRA